MHPSRAIVFSLVLFCGAAHGQVFSFATYSWDQADTPDTYLALVAGSYNGAVIDALKSTATGTVMFPDSAAGFDGTLSIGVVSGIGSAPGPRALNLPAGNNGTNTRSGFELSWSAGRTLINEAGDDFALYESASTSTADEGLAIQVFDSTAGAWSIWYTQAFDAFADYDGGADGAMAYAIDLSDLGIPASNEIDTIRVVNLTNRDTLGPVAGSGREVLMENLTGDPSGFGSGALDPDPLYLGVINTVTPVELQSFSIE